MRTESDIYGVNSLLEEGSSEPIKKYQREKHIAIKRIKGRYNV